MASNNYSQGAQVEHQKFGLGTVMSSNDERIVIKFDDHGEKKFVTPMVMGSLTSWHVSIPRIPRKTAKGKGNEVAASRQKKRR